MAKQQQFMLVMVSTVAILTPGTVETVKYVCPGDSVQIFEDIDYDHCNAFISLSMNWRGDVACWSFKNCSLNETILKEYKKRLFYDRNGTITIRKLHQFDHGNYIVMVKTDTTVSIQEVEIYVMDAPNKNCKPKIERFGNTLHAELPSDSCGNPVTTLYWRNVDDFPDTREPVLQIVPGKEPHAYYACIEGDALRCTQSVTPLEYCSTYVIEGNNRGTEPNNTPLVIVSVTSVVVIILLVVFVVLYIMCMKLRTNKRKASGKSVPKNHYKSDLDVESDLLKLSQIDTNDSGEIVSMKDSNAEDEFNKLSNAINQLRNNRRCEEYLQCTMP